jgi:hypothetical protein
VPEIVVASFNMHSGVDGWARPYDVVGACEHLAADVLVLVENFVPDGEEGVAACVAGKLGYEVRSASIARARRYPPAEGQRRGFGPPFWSERPVGVSVLFPNPPRARARRPRRGQGVEGDWGIAVLSRLPVTRFEDLDLGQLRRDPARRRAILAEVDVGGAPLVVAGVHMSHITHGSVAQFRRLTRSLPPPDVPAVLCGDLNVWGPPLRALLPGWRRAVRGRTWPADHPIAQIDHLLVRPSVEVADSEVVQVGRSDHRAVRARLVV